MTQQACASHPTVAAAASCSRCGRAVCDVCLFRFLGRPFCPDCATAGPAPEERSKVFSSGLLSVVLAVLGYAMLVGVLLAGAAEIEIAPGLDALLTTVWFGLGVGGLAVGIGAREGARRTGSVLPMIGMIASGLLLVVILVLAVFGSMQ